MAISAGSHRFSITLTGPVNDMLKQLCSANGVSRSAMISLGIKKKWEEENRTEEEGGGEITSE